MYSISLIAISASAAAKGDLAEGMVWILQPGTYDEQQNNVPLEDRACSSHYKIVVMIFFSSMGFFGSSCAAAITKHFGALSMSITSVSRKATTLFLSFLLFPNVCTSQHIIGIIIFISALTAKSIRRKNKKRKSTIGSSDRFRKSNSMDLEMGRGKLSRESSIASDESTDTTSSDNNGNSSRRKKVSFNRTTVQERTSPNKGGIQRAQYHVV